MELTGKIKAIFDTKEITPTFKKREFVLTTEEQYPQHIMLEMIQKNTDKLDGFNAGDSVTVGIKGREWTSPQGETKYFNTIQAWRIDRAGAAAPQSAPAPAAAAPAAPAAAPSFPPAPPMDSFEEQDDDLPF
jgi:single-stranded DNA-binding protein